MNEEILKKLYASASEVFDMPNYEQFVLDMQDENNLSSFRNSMSEHYDIPELDQFKADLGFSKKKKIRNLLQRMVLWIHKTLSL